MSARPAPVTDTLDPAFLLMGPIDMLQRHLDDMMGRDLRSIEERHRLQAKHKRHIAEFRRAIDLLWDHNGFKPDTN